MGPQLPYIPPDTDDDTIWTFGRLGNITVRGPRGMFPQPTPTRVVPVKLTGDTPSRKKLLKQKNLRRSR